VSPVSLSWWNGCTIAQRDLVAATECPRCSSLAFDLLCQPHEQIGPTRGYQPVRCALCETEYAYPSDAMSLRDMQQASHDATDRAIEQALAMCEHERRQRSRKVREFFGLEHGELARGLDIPIYVNPHTYAQIAAPISHRSLLERVVDAFRGAAAGWRGAL
jgi:hypothetical protein